MFTKRGKVINANYILVEVKQDGKKESQLYTPSESVRQKYRLQAIKDNKKLDNKKVYFKTNGNRLTYLSRTKPKKSSFGKSSGYVRRSKL